MGGWGGTVAAASAAKTRRKVDRSAAYAARWAAKNVVAAGLAERCEIQVAYAIGVAHPLSVNVETFGTGRISSDEIASLIQEHFDLRPGAIIRDFKAAPPDLSPGGGLRALRTDDLDLPGRKPTRPRHCAAAAGITRPVAIPAD